MRNEDRTTKEKPPLLRLPDKPDELWRTVRDALLEHARRENAGAELRITGGGVLAGRWEHRESHDLDILAYSAGSEERMDRWIREAAEEMGAAVTGEPGNLNRMLLLREDAPLREHVDILIGRYERLRPAEKALIAGRVEAVSETAEILYFKLAGRGANAPLRDALDVLAAKDFEPDGLERAVNALTLGERAALYKGMEMNGAAYEEEIEKIEMKNWKGPDPDRMIEDQTTEAVEERIWNRIVMERERSGDTRICTYSAVGKTERRTADHEWKQEMKKGWYDLACKARGKGIEEVQEELEKTGKVELLRMRFPGILLWLTGLPVQALLRHFATAG